MTKRVFARIIAAVVCVVCFGAGAGGAHAQVLIVGNQTTTCPGNMIVSSGGISVVDSMGGLVIGCPGCTPGTNFYPIMGRNDVLALIYGGKHHDGTVDCAGNVRTSLVNKWQNLFATTCAGMTACTELVHAWRPPDASPASTALLAALGISAFCNGNQLADKDLVRRGCAGTSPASGDDVCEADGSLGLVLPIYIPGPTTPATALVDLYPSLSPTPFMCNPGFFGLEATGSAALPCPNGPEFLGKCFQPSLMLPDGTQTFECLTTKAARAFASPSGTDGRVWNLQIKKLDTAFTPIRPAEYVRDSSGAFMTGAYFRDQAVPAPGCTFGPGSEDPQIGCMVNANTCSLGAAGPTAINPSNQAL
jgi:hypothetical protein